jgi:hypothetical protein
MRHVATPCDANVDGFVQLCVNGDFVLQRPGLSRSRFSTTARALGIATVPTHSFDARARCKRGEGTGWRSWRACSLFPAAVGHPRGWAHLRLGDLMNGTERYILARDETLGRWHNLLVQTTYLARRMTGVSWAGHARPGGRGLSIGVRSRPTVDKRDLQLLPEGAGGAVARSGCRVDDAPADELRAPRHPNCDLSPSQFAEKFGKGSDPSPPVVRDDPDGPGRPPPAPGRLRPPARPTARCPSRPMPWPRRNAGHPGRRTGRRPRLSPGPAASARR